MDPFDIYTLRDYLLAMHQIDLIWKPESADEEPPF